MPSLPRTSRTAHSRAPGNCHKYRSLYSEKKPNSHHSYYFLPKLLVKPPPALASFFSFIAALFSSFAFPPFGLFISDLEPAMRRYASDGIRQSSAGILRQV